MGSSESVSADGSGKIVVGFTHGHLLGVPTGWVPLNADSVSASALGTETLSVPRVTFPP
jgi:hypothetical protein